MQAPGSSQAGSGRVSTRCVCVPACPFRRDFASARRSPKAVPEKRVAAAAARGTAGRRARYDGTLQALGEARKRSQRNGSPPQQRGKQHLPHQAGVPASTGLCKRRAKPESGPRETGRRRRNEGNRSSNEGNRSSEGNSSASQGRHPSSCPTSPACKQPNMQPIPSALHAVNPGSPTGSPTISQSRQRMLGLQVRSMSA